MHVQVLGSLPCIPKIHKVLHCKPSEGKPTEARQKTTWNRDVNASNNILMLLMKELEGKPRPDPFVSAKMKKTALAAYGGDHTRNMGT